MSEERCFCTAAHSSQHSHVLFLIFSTWVEQRGMCSILRLSLVYIVLHIFTVWQNLISYNLLCFNVYHSIFIWQISLKLTILQLAKSPHKVYDKIIERILWVLIRSSRFSFLKPRTSLENALCDAGFQKQHSQWLFHYHEIIGLLLNYISKRNNKEILKYSSFLLWISIDQDLQKYG